MSVHKDKNTGRWYYTGKYRDLLGNRHDYKKRGFRTKTEAKEAEEAFLLKIKGGRGRIKMKALIVLYHEEKSSTIKRSTLYQYDVIERLHILPVFGNRYIDTIKTTEITRWNRERGLTGNNGGAYSQEYITNMFLHMSGLLTFAVNHRFINENPCRYTKPFKDPNQVKPAQESEVNFWEVDEYNRFISTIEDQNYRETYDTLFLTGLRIGEACALRWCDIDLVNRKLSVKGTFSTVSGSVTSPKTANSFRTIDLPIRLADELRDRLERHKKLDGFTQEYYVFGDIRPVYPGTVRRHFNKDVKAAGVKPITIHGLRHSHASYLLSNPQLSEALVAERMGHSIDMLRSTYAHIYEKRRGALVDYIENL